MYIAGAILIFVGIIFNVIKIKWFNENDAVGIITIELIGIGLVLASIEGLINEGAVALFLTVLGGLLVISPLFWKRKK